MKFVVYGVEWKDENKVLRTIMEVQAHHFEVTTQGELLFFREPSERPSHAFMRHDWSYVAPVE